MANNYVILSDIHGNLSALDAVLADIEQANVCVNGCIILGDLINYGMRSNDVINRVAQLNYPVVYIIRGNHEEAILSNDYSRFSSERGKAVARFTRDVLSDASWVFLRNIVGQSGKCVIEISGKKILLVHATIEDNYWGKFSTRNVDEVYSEYDYVLMGHSHIQLMYQHFFTTKNSEYRNKKRTVFINPGSVGQPRNHNPRSQYAVIDFDTENISFRSIEYDIAAEQKLYSESVDSFYKDRLINGV